MKGARGLALAAAVLAAGAGAVAAPEPECPEGQTYHVDRCMTMPKRIKEVPPEFPQPAREQHQFNEAFVILSAVVQTDGSVGDIKVERCSREGYGFEEVAIKAVSQWKYEPAIVDGKPVAFAFHIRVDFRKEDGDIRRL